ncbi:MAG: hypothetical protein C0483_00280 [Pirellula sp.]|nr:hypothetical protein [Pirellula sp.]
MSSFKPSSPNRPTAPPTSWICDRPMILGRDSSCDCVLECDRVSRQHARIVPAGDVLIIEDLGSSNGTLHNGHLVEEPTPLRPGDIVTIGSFRLELSPEGRLERTERLAALTVEARDISFDAGNRKLLEGVSLTFFSSEFVGLMGPSGSGKTTLMNLLNGYLFPARGKVTLNGYDLHAHYADYGSLIGYVPQDDIMHNELTVDQALSFTARLRMPADTTDEEIRKRVTGVLKQLQIEGTRYVRIGSPERKGISGGQRKRVNLAMELLTDPAVLFLDEPTSGLSSEDAFVVMTLLRRLADIGKGILLTVHQPGREAFRLMDLLAIVARDTNERDPGRLVYFGPAHPDAVEFFNPQLDATKGERDLSPERVLRGLSTRSAEEWRRRFQESAYYKNYVEARAGKVPSREMLAPPRNNDVVQQCITLVRRSLTIKIADRWNTVILLAQAPIVAMLVIVVFGEHARQQITSESWLRTTGATAVTVFLLCLSSLWFGCSNAVREIVGEWAIFQRERMVNLQLPAYVASKLIVGAILCTIQCAVLLIAARWGCGLRAPIASSFLIMMLTACTGVGIGLIISAVARTQEVAMALLPLVLIPMVIFGGTLLPIHDMQRFVRPAAFIMPTRHGFEAMLLLEAERKPLGPSPYSNTIVTDRSINDPDRPDFAEYYLPKKKRLGTTASVVALSVVFAATLAAVLLILRFRDVH